MMTPKPITVSVIVPNFNHAPYLEQRLDSIFNQTFQDFEVIILDDASQDGSQALLQAYANHPKVSHVVINTVNSGSVYKQWSKGIGLAQGTFIWIAESDDYADPYFLEHTVAALNAQDALGMVFTDTCKVNAQGDELGLVSESKRIYKDLVAASNLIDAHNATKYLLNKMIIVNASSALFRKSLLTTIDMNVLELFKNTGDVFTYLHMALHGDILFVNKPLNYMRLHGSNTTKKGKQSGAIYKDKLRLLHYYIPYFKGLPSSQADVLRFYYNNFFFSLDFKLQDSVRQNLIALHDMGFIDDTAYAQTRRLMGTYSFVTHRGRPAFLRNYFKRVLKQTLAIN
ncbi:hypothetical protein C1T31_13465 [Hanstruepera neustonica]|uniref:Glycosyltransferase 2-like domain-containing protein n=1 Tax=Hanstruepera neustonica TaxID=1445657 RepID=A0A2K1DVR2_9FLAO|nr:glycosyltransferase [Hanstruepera neustonica]PNQ72107.1 hypothetical protein C1T31_13465 [Hanstruepera neustonica]